MEHGLSDIVQKIGHTTKFDLNFLIHGSLAGRRTYHTLRIRNNTTNSPNNIQGQVEKAADGERRERESLQYSQISGHCRVALQVMLACQYTILLLTTILCLTE